MVELRRSGGFFPGMPGGMAEWTKAAVLKTAVGDKPTGGSNPSPSASVLWQRDVITSTLINLGRCQSG